ncbi:GerAB/ArcD/ProY family transporter [Paenibacillus sp. CN-4]|uniref:GerAB/ArcD/ProY family transporter n=1 Tax=Paenibacillus nanchangensis TaxID=3348343 RepID=UPI00397A0A22
MRSSGWQLFRFGFVYFNSQATTFLVPALYSGEPYQGWAGILGGTAVSLLLLAAMMYTARAKPGEEWIRFGKEVTGRWVHGLLVVLLLLWGVYYASSDIENFVLFFGSNYLRETPHWFIQAAITVVIIFTAQLGRVTIIYMTDGLFVIIAAVTVFTLCMFMQTADFRMLPAVFHHFDLKTTATHTLTVASWFSEWIVFLFIGPQLLQQKGAFKKLAAVQLTIMLSVLLGWLLTLLNFGPYLAREMQFPYLGTVRATAQRGALNLDPLLIGLWASSMLIHSSFVIYIASRCVKYFIKNRGSGYVIPLLGIGAFAIAALYSRNIERYMKDYYSMWLIWVWIGFEFIPALYALLLRIRRKKERPAGAQD